MSSVLVIDDDTLIHQKIAAPLSDLADEVIHAYRPEEGLRLAIQRSPDLVLLDVNMPGMDGLKLCRHLKDTQSTRNIPVVFLTIEHNLHILSRAFDLGGTDYILKPWSEIELRARVGVALRTKRMFDLLREQARIDALTGLTNRAGLEAGLESAVASNDRNDRPVSVLIFDLDGFKAVNDEHGHGAGDELLRRVGESLKRHCRPYDSPCRFGGDEFVVLLGDTEGPNASAAGHRLLSKLQEIEIETATGNLVVACSAGLAGSHDMEPGFQPAELMKAADTALYRAKHAGGNRLEIWRPGEA